MGRTIAATLTLAALAACGSSSDSRASDREALAICVRFYEITDDIKAGIATSSQATTRLVDLHQTARHIDNVTLRDRVANLAAARNQRNDQRIFFELVDRECMRLTAKYAD